MPRDRQRLLAYAVEDYAPLYRAIMHVFVTGADSYHLRLRVDEVLALLPTVGEYPHPVTRDELTNRLTSLCGWGNLHRHRDEALTDTLAEFESRGFVYDLTPGGERAPPWRSRMPERPTPASRGCPSRCPARRPRVSRWTMTYSSGCAVRPGPGSPDRCALRSSGGVAPSRR